MIMKQFPPLFFAVFQEEQKTPFDAGKIIIMIKVRLKGKRCVRRKNWEKEKGKERSEGKKYHFQELFDGDWGKKYNKKEEEPLENTSTQLLYY